MEKFLVVWRGLPIIITESDQAPAPNPPPTQKKFFLSANSFLLCWRSGHLPHLPWLWAARVPEAGESRCDTSTRHEALQIGLVSPSFSPRLENYESRNPPPPSPWMWYAKIYFPRTLSALFSILPTFYTFSFMFPLFFSNSPFSPRRYPVTGTWEVLWICGQEKVLRKKIFSSIKPPFSPLSKLQPHNPPLHMFFLYLFPLYLFLFYNFPFLFFFFFFCLFPCSGRQVLR